MNDIWMERMTGFFVGFIVGNAHAIWRNLDDIMAGEKARRKPDGR